MIDQSIRHSNNILPDLLAISDKDTWAYGESLRNLALTKQFNNIRFSRIKDLLDIEIPDNLREITYVANCSNFRRALLNDFGKADLDIDKEIATNTDTRLTYLGYRRFLESDLRHIFPPGEDRTKNGYKRDVKYLAKQMLIRGYAFAAAIKKAYPEHLRLSIHESVGEHKLSISLLNTRTGYTTPWHCCVALLADGEWISGPKEDFEKDSRLELIYEIDRPSYFQERNFGPNDLNMKSSWASFLASPTKLTASSSGYTTPSLERSSSTTSSPSIYSISTTSKIQDDPTSAASGKLSPLAKSDSSLQPNDADAGSYGRRLIPQIMDQLALDEPNRTVFTLSTMSKNKLEFREISARLFSNAVDKTAWWLLNQVGRPESVQPIGYIGPRT